MPEVCIGIAKEILSCESIRRTRAPLTHYGDFKRVEHVTRGDYARRHYRFNVVCEWHPDGRIYRIEDGHLPDYQPRVPAEEVPRILLGSAPDHPHTAWPVSDEELSCETHNREEV